MPDIISVCTRDSIYSVHCIAVADKEDGADEKSVEFWGEKLLE
jgi:hypothetical protein